MKKLKIIGIVILEIFCFGIAIQILMTGVALITSLVSRMEADYSIKLLGQFSADIFMLALFIAGVKALFKSLEKSSLKFSGQ